MYRAFTKSFGLCVVLTVPLMSGCGESHDMGLVTGTITIDGKPGDEIQVRFSPTGDTTGPNSFSETDAQGKFTLTMFDKAGIPTPGAVVGTHKVVLYDLRLGASVTGKGIPIRLKPEYSLPGQTPLTKEVAAGEQTIDIVVP